MTPEDLVISIPHGSTYIPEEIRALMPHDDHVLLNEPDLYTDRIYNIKGPTVVQARTSRIISDVNRAPDEIYTKGRMRANGVIMLSLSHGLDTFEKDPTEEQMRDWISSYHESFHRELHGAMRDALFLIDGHSLWSHSPPSQEDAGAERADIVLGNRLYTTCNAQTTQFFRHYFEKLGYSVAVNNPYMGRYVVGTHCSRLHTPGIQIEMKRSLYMDEETLEPYENVIKKLQGEIETLVEEFCAWYKPKQRAAELVDLSI